MKKKNGVKVSYQPTVGYNNGRARLKIDTYVRYQRWPGWTVERMIKDNEDVSTLIKLGKEVGWRGTIHFGLGNGNGVKQIKTPIFPTIEEVRDWASEWIERHHSVFEDITVKVQAPTK